MLKHLGVHLISLLTGYRASFRVKPLLVLKLLAEALSLTADLRAKIEFKHSKFIFHRD